MPSRRSPIPLVYGQVLIPGKPFCARPKLESSVPEAATHQHRIVLLGERRMGKSSLVEHTLMRSDRILVAVDLREREGKTKGFHCDLRVECRRTSESLAAICGVLR